MRLVLRSVSSRWLRHGLVAVGVVALANASAAAYANCSEFAGRAQRRAPINWIPQREQGAYRLVTVANDERSPEITGLWHLEFIVDNAVVDTAYETFMADGNELMVDTTPPAFGNVCNGIWVQTGRVYKVKHPSFLFDSNGSVTGSAIIRTELRLSRKGDSFTGKTTIEIYDVAGNLLDTLKADARATRVQFD